MLKRLYISNFALIEEMDVSFPGNLTVVTGETGAGKSIFLEALGLALGRRADLESAKNKTKKCIVEAEFNTEGLDLKAFFDENDLDFESHITLRREINSEGKSRSFLNDSVVSLSALKTLSEKLIDIHSQHQTLLLNQANFQLEVVDAFAGSMAHYKAYKAEYAKLCKNQTSLSLLMKQEAQAKKELDYFQFMFAELEEAQLKPGILKQLEDESATLENAEMIKTALIVAGTQLNGGETNLLMTLAQIKQSLNTIGKFNSRYLQLYERANSTFIELKELASELEDAGEAISVNDTALNEVNSKLDKLNRLLNKHGVKTEESLLQIKAEIERKLLGFSSLEKEIEKTKNEIASRTDSCTKQANELSRTRKKSLPFLEKQVVDLLRDLSMGNANFKIELTPLTELSSAGFDMVKFLFSANKGIALSELQKVASGGELSRLMLSLKALLATKKQLPTIIFDEIDTGVSGEVADKIGTILSRMGEGMQVIAITHLPQMASKGDHHLFVYKKDNTDKTVSYIKELTKEDRVTEIAKMLSTGNPTQSALKNAKELLSLN